MPEHGRGETPQSGRQGVGRGFRHALPQRFRRNVAVVYLNTFVTVGVVLVMTPLLVHGLGKEQYGIWVLVVALSPYASILDLGVGAATTKYVAEYHGRDDGLVAKATATSFAMLTALGGLVVLLGVPFAFVFPAAFNVAPADSTAATLAVLAFVLSAAIALPANTFPSVLVAVQRYDVAYAIVVAVNVARAAGWAIVLAAGGGIAALAVVTVAIEIVGQGVRLVAVRRLVPSALYSPRLFDRRSAGGILRLSGWIALGQASVLVVHRIDPLVVGAVVSVPAAGVYGVGQRVAVGVERLVGPLTTGFFPRAAELAGRRDEAAMRETMLAGTRIALAVAGPCVVTVVVLAKPAIHAWVGPGFGSAANVAIYLVLAMAITAVTRAGFLMLQGAGRAHVTARFVAVEAAMNLGLSIFFGRRIGLEGVALGTLIAAAITRLGLLLPYVCRCFGVGVVEFVGSIARAHLPPLAVAGAVGWLLSQADLFSIPMLSLAAIALVSAYVLTFSLTGLTRDERRQLSARAHRWRARVFAGAS
jgi:O-antigen/teichoic acid export membrane protein